MFFMSKFLDAAVSQMYSRKEWCYMMADNSTSNSVHWFDWKGHPCFDKVIIISCRAFDFLPSVKQHMETASLIICHAGKKVLQ